MRERTNRITIAVQVNRLAFAELACEYGCSSYGSLGDMISEADLDAVYA